MAVVDAEIVGKARQIVGEDFLLARSHAFQPITPDAVFIGFRHQQIAGAGPDRNAVRSEEHTSELQSLMRISYAVFCLKKKKNSTTHTQTNNLKTYNQTMQSV